MARIDRVRRRKRLWLAGALLAAAAGLVARAWLRPSPQALYDRAVLLLSSNPVAAEELFRKSLVCAGGGFPDAQLQLALLATRRHDWNQVRTICAGLDQPGVRSDLLLELGREAVAAHEWDLARRVRGELRERPPREAAPALQNLAALYRLHRRPAEELACLEELTTIAPDDPRSWWQLAQAYEVRESPADAAAAYRRALEHELPRKDEFEMRHRRIERLLDVGDADAARDELDRLVARGDSQVARLQVHRAHLHRLAGDFRGALADLESVWPQIGEIPEAIKLRAILQFDAGQLEEARQGLEIVIAVRPFDEMAHFKLAEACRRLGLSEEEQAHRELHRSIQAKRLEIRRLTAQLDRAPPTRDVCLKLARLHRELKERDRATYWTNVSRTLE
ncbi:MAG: tetratricopeptide repeat protein [Deltaproteobacteria bacterium]